VETQALGYSPHDGPIATAIQPMVPRPGIKMLTQERRDDLGPWPPEGRRGMEGQRLEKSIQWKVKSNRRGTSLEKGETR